MSIEHVKLFDFFLGLFFQQVELAEKINITLGQSKVAVKRDFTPLKIVKT